VLHFITDGYFGSYQTADWLAGSHNPLLGPALNSILEDTVGTSTDCRILQSVRVGAQAVLAAVHLTADPAPASG
jgi:hypothetical protein